jgi:hypothetical protein
MCKASPAHSLAELARFNLAARRQDAMPRHVIERDFPDGLGLAPNERKMGLLDQPC